ncbi:hypothetical protein NMG60_11024466 [Bertholletia excelsa]
MGFRLVVLAVETLARVSLGPFLLLDYPVRSFVCRPDQEIYPHVLLLGLQKLSFETSYWRSYDVSVLSFPPPGYAVNRHSEEALIESIKLQKEREKARAERKKEKKRDKKERQIERESNEKPDNNEFAHGSKRKHNAEHQGKLETEHVHLKSTQSQKQITSDVSQLGEERLKAKAERRKEKQQKKDRKREKEANVKLDPSEALHGKKRKLNEEETRKWETKTSDLKSNCIQNVGEEGELERSGVTEDHEPPVCLQKPCNSSDSTDNSNKRRQLLPITGISAHGNILKIRLSAQNQPKTDDVVSKVRLCSASAITDSTGPQLSTTLRNDQGCSISGIAQDSLFRAPVASDPQGSTSGIAPNSVFRAPVVSTHQGCSTLEIAQDSLFRAPVASSHRERKIQKAESLYHELVESWVPPALETLQMDLDEEDWLFQSKRRTDGERPKTCGDAACASSGSMWPQATYLAEADVYALPFAVPF